MGFPLHGTKIGDLRWPWTLDSIMTVISRYNLLSTVKIRTVP